MSAQMFNGLKKSTKRFTWYTGYMIKAIIFDCFGVLSTDGWKQIREEYFARDEETMRRAMDMDKAVNAGMMSLDEFYAEIAATSGLSEEEVRKRIDGNSPNRLLLDFIRDELKPKFKIGMLSNAAANWLGELFEPEQVKLFDEVLLSYEIGAVKPEAVMYTTIVARLGMQPEECLFIDDLERYCEAAKNLGMQAIYHHDTHDTIAKIKEIVGA